VLPASNTAYSDNHFQILSSRRNVVGTSAHIYSFVWPPGHMLQFSPAPPRGAHPHDATHQKQCTLSAPAQQEHNWHEVPTTASTNPVGWAPLAHLPHLTATHCGCDNNNEPSTHELHPYPPTSSMPTPSIHIVSTPLPGQPFTAQVCALLGGRPPQLASPPAALLAGQPWQGEPSRLGTAPALGARCLWRFTSPTTHC
jgi:hypothetical protein